MTGRLAVPGDRWRRESLHLEAPEGTGEIQPFWSCNIEANSSYVAVLAAPQVEAGIGASTPIKTDGEAVTRAADVATIAVDATRAGTIAIDASFTNDASAAITFDQSLCFDQRHPCYLGARG